MWKCEICGEEHEDQFSSCWKCAKAPESVDGASILDEMIAKAPGERSLDEHLAVAFKCSKCASGGALVKRIAATGTGLSKMFDIQSNTFIALSCRKCGFVDLYDTDILEGQWRAGTLLDWFVG